MKNVDTFAHSLKLACGLKVWASEKSMAREFRNAFDTVWEDLIRRDRRAIRKWWRQFPALPWHCVEIVPQDALDSQRNGVLHVIFGQTLPSAIGMRFSMRTLALVPEDRARIIAHELAHVFAYTIWPRHHEDPYAESVADSIMEDWGYDPPDRGYDPNPATSDDDE